MGNTNLCSTHVEDLIFLKHNSLTFSQNEEENYKQNVRAEKK